jgi:hypothetical protein
MTNSDDFDKKQFIWAISEPSFASMRAERAHRLLLEISRCAIALECLADPHSDSPCAAIVASQKSSDGGDRPFQVPEPWSGDLTKAFILFVASNPSISWEEQYPNLSWSDPYLIDYFMNRFGGGREEWIQGGSRGLRVDGSYSKGTAFWRFVRNRAQELLQREPKPGIDYALTEVVRCKSENETGVDSAADVCSERYLERTIAAARAPVVVILSSWAKVKICSLLNLDSIGVNQILGPVEIGGRERLLAFLPHSNARVARTFATFSCRDLEQLRLFIREEE